MKKIVVHILVLVIAISMVTPAFGQDNETILIYPWLIQPDEYGDRIITVSQDQEILLGARWGACTKGLSHAWAVTTDVAYEIDGQPVFASLDDTRQYWSLPPVPVVVSGPSPCLNNSKVGWYVYWEYELGTLSPGDHSAHFEYWNDHLLIDGGDYDGDGRPDKWFGTTVDFIIRVEE